MFYLFSGPTTFSFILFFVYILCWIFLRNPLKAALVLILLCILGAVWFNQHVYQVNHTDRRCRPVPGLLDNGGCGDEATSSERSD